MYSQSSDPSLCPPPPQLYPVARAGGCRCCRGGNACTPVPAILGVAPPPTRAPTHDGARPNSRTPGRPCLSSPYINHHHRCPTTAPVTLTAAAPVPPVTASIAAHS